MARLQAVPKKPDDNAKVLGLDDQGRAAKLTRAEFYLSAATVNSQTSELFAGGANGGIDLGDHINVMEGSILRIKEGDLSGMEAVLAAQAETLNTIFNKLARRAAVNIGKNMPATEAYMKMALKAQSQCRSTIEAISEMKCPKSVTFVKQANIANQQQVNNGSTTGPVPRTEKNINRRNELLEGAQHDGLDVGTTSKASGNDSGMETVGALYGAANG